MNRLEKLLAEVSTDEELLNEENEEIVDEEYFSDHQSHSEEELDSSNESDCCEPCEYYLGRDSLTKWYKKETRKYVRKLAHNIVIKLPGNYCTLKNVSSPFEFSNCLLTKKFYKRF